MADLFDRSLGIGYLGGSLSRLALVLGSLGLWYRSEGTVAVETVSRSAMICSVTRARPPGGAVGGLTGDPAPRGPLLVITLFSGPGNTI